MSLSTDEVRFLRSHRTEVDAAIASRSLRNDTSVADAQFFRHQFGDYGRAVMELGRARRASVDKLPQEWLMCHESAQQATPLPVAQVRATRIADAVPHARIYDVTCSIGTEGAAVAGANLEYVGSDISLPRLLMAQENLGGSTGVHNWSLVCADALRPATTMTSSDVVIADPARRHSGRRITRPDDLIPPLPMIVDTYKSHHVAIKCSPGLDFSEWEGLVSVVSVDGGVKEACLYSPGLAEFTHREAVIIADNGRHRDRITDAADDDIEVAPPGRFIIDPDGAIVRAGLVRHYGHREHLWMLDHRIAYLSGDRIPAGTSGFEYLETVSLKKLKAALRAHRCGSLEILVRGVDVDPDALRRKLALKGDRPRAVVITRLGSTAVALICRARQHAPDVGF